METPPEPVLGPGVTSADVAWMRREVSDFHADEARTSVLLAGKAVKGEESKRFVWNFLQGYQLSLSSDEDAGPGKALLLGAFVYEERLPRLLGVMGAGKCKAEARGRRGR